MIDDGDTKNNRIAFLDYLRIFAFSSVLIGHIYYESLLEISYSQEIHQTPRLVASFMLHLMSGGAGVVVFFFVSGYIIAHVLQTEGFKEFLVKRIFRIYPLYMVAVLGEFIVERSSTVPQLLQQLLLVGDFFDTPGVLGGADWTLRIEVVYYIFMAFLCALGLMKKHKAILPYVLTAATLFCSFVAPFPIDKGLLTSYGPFLFLGSMLYLFEKKQIGLEFLLFFVGLVFYQHYKLLVIAQPIWLDSGSWRDCHFAALAFLVFIGAWIFRRHIKVTPWVILLSDMTYAVYIFHLYIFRYIKKQVSNFNFLFISSDILTLIIFLFFCYIMVIAIEKPGIKCGRYIIKKFRIGHV